MAYVHGTRCLIERIQLANAGNLANQVQGESDLKVKDCVTGGRIPTIATR